MNQSWSDKVAQKYVDDCCPYLLPYLEVKAENHAIVKERKVNHYSEYPSSELL